jgi:hypothetical protein
MVRKIFSASVLTTIFLGLIGWAGTNINANKQKTLENAGEIKVNRSNISRDYNQLNRIENKLDKIIEKL